MRIGLPAACIVVLVILAAPAAMAQTIQIDVMHGTLSINTGNGPGAAITTNALDPADGPTRFSVHPFTSSPPPQEERREPSSDNGLSAPAGFDAPLALPRAPPALPSIVPPRIPMGAGLDLPLAIGPLKPEHQGPPTPPASSVETASVPVPVAPDSPFLPTVATTVAFAAVAAAAGAATPAATLGWDRLRRLAFLAVLYTRIAKERLLDHGSRDTLLTTIRERPGLPVTDLASIAGVPRNTATYHLRRLEREGIVASQRDGRVRLWFSVGGNARRDEAPAYAALRHDTTRAIAREVAASPGMDQQALCARFSLAPSLAHWHADRLVASGLVRKERDGRRVRYYPTEGLPRYAAYSA